tara:strand:- start:7756 stop:8817 length:1062 start_codon:yes stop_codon:yes gene_type:complete
MAVVTVKNTLNVDNVSHFTSKARVYCPLLPAIANYNAGFAVVRRQHVPLDTYDIVFSLRAFYPLSYSWHENPPMSGWAEGWSPVQRVQQPTNAEIARQAAQPFPGAYNPFVTPPRSNVGLYHAGPPPVRPPPGLVAALQTAPKHVVPAVLPILPQQALTLGKVNGSFKDIKRPESFEPLRVATAVTAQEYENMAHNNTMLQRGVVFWMPLNDLAGQDGVAFFHGPNAYMGKKTVMCKRTLPTPQNPHMLWILAHSLYGALRGFSEQADATKKVKNAWEFKQAGHCDGVHCDGRGDHMFCKMNEAEIMSAHYLKTNYNSVRMSFLILFLFIICTGKSNLTSRSGCFLVQFFDLI